MLVALPALLLFGSCTRPISEITYVRGIKTGLVHDDSLSTKDYLITPNDHLYIVVMGDDPVTTSFLNLTEATRNSYGNQNLELITYTVDEHGYISFPQLGQVYVQGKTVLEVQNEIQNLARNYIEGIAVQVKLVDRTITVLGEVNDPGVHQINKNQLTIFEALGNAGDINDWGDRENVRLFRKTSEGLEIVKLDLTDPALIYSPYFHILPNDAIIVDASSRVFGFKTLNFVSIFTLSFTLISTTILLVSFFQ